MLDDDARRALEQEAIALVNLSNSQPLLKKRPAPTAAEAVVASKRRAPPHGDAVVAGVHLLLQQNKATLMARRDDRRAPHPHPHPHRVNATATATAVCRPHSRMPLPDDHDDRHLSMSVFVNADGNVSVLPGASGKGTPGAAHTAFEVDPTAVKVSSTATSTAPSDSPISMQSLLVTLKKHKSENGHDADVAPPSTIKLPRFRDVFDPALKDHRSTLPSLRIQPLAVPYAAPPPATSTSTSPTAEDAPVMRIEDAACAPPPELKCKYRTGKCGNQRALKSCGDNHNLCNYHRLRANANQRKLDRKKKVQRGHPDAEDAVSEATLPVAAPTGGSPTKISAAATTLASLPTSFLMPRAAPPSSSGASYMPYLMPPSGLTGRTLPRPKSEPKSC